MGFRDFLRKQVNGWNETKADFELGCEILGPPADPRSVLQRRDRVEAGRKARLARQEQEETWTKSRMSYDRDTGLEQTDTFIGYVGSRDQKRKAHIAINVNGDVVYVRDMDGTVLYDRKNNIGHLPSDLDWNR